MLQFRGLAHLEWADNFHFIHFHSHLVCFMALAKCCKNLIYNPQVEPLIIHDVSGCQSDRGRSHGISCHSYLPSVSMQRNIAWQTHLSVVRVLKGSRICKSTISILRLLTLSATIQLVSLSILFELDFRRVFVNMRKTFSLFPLRQPLEAPNERPSEPTVARMESLFAFDSCHAAL